MLNRWIGCAAVAGALIVGLPSAGQDKAKAPAPKPGDQKASAPDAQAKAAMEAMAKAAQPGPNHKLLAEMAGSWTVQVKAWMGPGEPSVSKGTAEDKVILGGRFLQETYKGSWEGQPFEGMGLTGFDNVLKKFTSAWVDTMGTGIMAGSGEADASGKILTFHLFYADPASGKVKTYRQVLRIADKNHHSFEMYESQPDGKEIRTMEMTYTRKA